MSSYSKCWPAVPSSSTCPFWIGRVIVAIGVVVLLLSVYQPAFAVVKTYHHGVDGYSGVKDTFIRHSYSNPSEPEALADINFGFNAAISSSRTNLLDYAAPLPSGEMAGLVRFEDLNIPAGSVINSATLRLLKILDSSGNSFGYADYNASGSVKMSVAGMLLPWEEGLGNLLNVNIVEAGVEGGPTANHRLRPDSADPSTWVPWNEQLARAQSADYSSSSYDSTFDYGPIETSIEGILDGDGGYFDFDVSSTFSSQFSEGKMYGWRIGEDITEGMFNSDGIIAWRSSEYNGSDLTTEPFTGFHSPELVVDYTPPASAAGDFDADGDVDGDDFLAWQRGDVSSPPDANDLNDWQTNYGAGGSTLSGVTGIPEPSSGILLLLGGFLTVRSKRDRV